jgi:hypothetical protein
MAAITLDLTNIRNVASLSEAAHTFLEQIVECSPNIRELAIHPHPEARVSVSSAIANCIRKLQALECYQGPIVALSVFESLSTAPKLRCINSHLAHGRLNVAGPPSFTSLTTLEISASQAGIMVLLDSLKLSPVTRILCVIDGMDKTPDLGEITRKIRSVVASSLLHVKIKHIDPFNSHPASSLYPLFGCRQLAVVDLDVGGGSGPVGLNNSDLQLMAESWPNLEYLILPGSQAETAMIIHDKEKPLATLHGLIPFTQLCPRLKVLGVTFDASYNLGDFQRSGSSVTTLKIGQSWVNQPRAVARALAQLFPHLKEVRATWERWAVAQMKQVFFFNCQELGAIIQGTR